MNYNSDGEEVKNESSEKENGQFVYQTVMKGKQNSRAFSVASLTLSIISLICCSPWIALVLGCLGIAFAVFSRKNIGYFDGLSLAGLIVGIFGTVFAVMSIIFQYLLVNTELYKEIMEAMETYLNGVLDEPDLNIDPSNGSFV